MAANKGKNGDYLNVKILREFADKMIELESQGSKKTSTRPSLQRGEELQELIQAKFPGIGSDSLRIALWVDLYTYTRDTLSGNDYYFTLMDVDEAITELIKFEADNPDQFEMVSDWMNDFGCLFPDGRGSDIGAWFHDWFFEPLFEIEALVDGEHLYLENQTKAQLTKLSKSKSVRDRIQAAVNANEEDEIFEILSQDSASSVRLAVAKNPTAPDAILEILSADSDELVRKAALKKRD